jgi:hypothetical protein
MFGKTSKKNTVETEFGTMYLQKDGKTLYAEKNIEFGSSKKITLTVEHKVKASASRQFALYKLISSNAETLLQTAKDFYWSEHYGHLYKDWELEDIYLHDNDNSENNWEMRLLRKEGFEYCVIEFKGLTPISVSFNA